MSHTPAFSIIIPTYNAQSSIARALESCIKQSFNDIEILVIDDCGSDDSVRIAQAYALRDCRISIHHNPRNLGLFQTRLAGERVAKGAYILCLDADDYLTPTACERAYEAAQKSVSDATTLQSLPDIVHFKARYQGSKNASLLENLKHKARYILPTQWSKAPLKNSEIAHNFFLKSKHFPKFTLWDKCYKASLIKEALPYFADFSTSLNMAEDMLKFFVLASLAKSYVSVDARLYVYCLNATSITQSQSAREKKIRDMRHIIKALENLSEELHTPHAREIARTMSDHLRALIVLESRFDSCISTEGGGSTGFRESSATESNTATNATESSAFIAHAARHLTLLARFCVALLAHLALSRFSTAHTARLVLARFSMPRLAISARLCGFSAILGSLSYLCAYPYLYPKFWQAQALDSSPLRRANLSREVA